ncbi:MAG: riboflavin synthase [Actinomycetota bacterium]|nr:riboflavin synthase [Actinomycetota bacterium]
MFSGIIEELGRARERSGGRLVVDCRTVTVDSPIGASVAVNGTCLTVVENQGDALAFDVSEETFARTSLGNLSSGRSVNLERAVTLVSRIGGHLVQGHVDGVGEVSAVEPDTAGGLWLRLRIPAEILRYVVEKGSITVDGVSLTVAELHPDGVTISLIPHTLAVTTLGTAEQGHRVNLEVDMIAKYVERLMEGRGA